MKRATVSFGILAAVMILSGCTSPTASSGERPANSATAQNPQPSTASTRTATPNPTSTPIPKPSATPATTSATKVAEVAPSLEGKVKGTFLYFIDGGWLYVKAGITNLDASRTISQWTMEYWLTSENYKPYRFSTWTTPAGAMSVAPGSSLPPVVEGKWNLADWNTQKLGQGYPEGLAQEVLSNRSSWGVQVKIISAVFQ